MTELIDAVRANDFATVKRLLAQGADIEDMGMTGDTPLVEAAARGHTSIVTALLESGARIEDPRRIAYVLHVQLLLVAKGADAAASAPVNAVVAAALRGHVDTVELLEDYLSPLSGGGERWAALRYARHAAAVKSAAAH